jgi:hypothetical protein
VSGLKGNLRMEVQALKPSTLIEAIGLARLYEARNQGTRNLFGINIKESDPPPFFFFTFFCIDPPPRTSGEAPKSHGTKSEARPWPVF